MSHRPASPSPGDGRPQRRPARRGAANTTAGRSFVQRCDSGVGEGGRTVSFGPNSSDDEWPEPEGGHDASALGVSANSVSFRPVSSDVTDEYDDNVTGGRWQSARRFDSCRTIGLDSATTGDDDDDDDDNDEDSGTSTDSPEAEEEREGLDDSRSVVSSGSSKLWDLMESNVIRRRTEAADHPRLDSIAESSGPPKGQKRRVRTVAWIVVLVALSVSAAYFMAEDNFEFNILGILLGNDDDSRSLGLREPSHLGGDHNFDEMSPEERHHLARENRISARDSWEERLTQARHGHREGLSLHQEMNLMAREERILHEQRERIAAREERERQRHLGHITSKN